MRISSLEQRRAREDSQHLPATGLEKRLPLFPFFSLFLTHRMVTETEGCSHAVDLADTHAEAQNARGAAFGSRNSACRELSDKRFQERFGLLHAV
jgi:hypothetical protein